MTINIYFLLCIYISMYAYLRTYLFIFLMILNFKVEVVLLFKTTCVSYYAIFFFAAPPIICDID